MVVVLVVDDLAAAVVAVVADQVAVVADQVAVADDLVADVYACSVWTRCTALTTRILSSSGGTSLTQLRSSPPANPAPA